MKHLFPILLAVLLAGASCNVTKRLRPGETLYAGPKVKIEGVEKKPAGKLRTQLSTLVRPLPNASLLGFRYKLWLYNLGGGDSSKGFIKKFIRNLGEPPVLSSQVNLEKNRSVMENYLQNRGYFHAVAMADTTTKGKMTTFNFKAQPHEQYTIRAVYWPTDSSLLAKEINAVNKRTRLKVGEPYDLDTIKNERIRIDSRLKNRGYYYFNPDYLIARVDSTVGNNQVDIYVSVKPHLAKSDLVPYHINDIWVYPTYSIQDDSLLGIAPAEKYKDYFVIDPEHKFKLKTFERMLIFDKGDLYSRRDHNRSLNRLVSMGTFKFVKAKFEEVDTAGNYLDPYYFLTPLPQHSYKLEVTGLTKSNNATGSEVSISWTNRNTFRGAENLTVGIFGGLETQVYGGQAISITRFGGEVSLFFPRVIAPFRLNTTSDFVPKTNINLRYEFYSRTQQYTLNSYIGSYGFIWKTSIFNEHRFNVLNLNYVKPQSIDPAFQVALDTDVTLRRSIEPQFILGPSYNYNYNTNNRPNNRLHNFYFNANLEAPGNILGLASGTEFIKEKQGTGKFLNTIFSQYVRAEVEGRYYLRIGDKDHKTNILATRLLAGVGIPYGNSDALPFIKAFFIGGVNDLRAFRARSLGPGSYYVRNYKTSGIIPDQPGDIKLLASSEVRAKLISILNGAVFVDAGNIWTIKDDAERPGAKFGSDFLNQIAIGAGVGLRIDLSFLVVRVDLATPIRRPFETTTQNFDFGSASYRKENLILNLALGYPF